MAAITIYVNRLDPCQSEADYFNIGGNCRVEGMPIEDPNIDWNVDVPHDALSSAINTAIRDAAISQAELLEYTIGGLDKKTVFGGAVGL